MLLVIPALCHRFLFRLSLLSFLISTHNMPLVIILIAVRDKGVIAIFIVDRLEKDWVVLEFERGTFNIPKALFPQQVREGDVVKITIIIDEDATKGRKKKAEHLADELFED